MATKAEGKSDELWPLWTGRMLAQCAEWAHGTYHAFRRGGKAAFDKYCEEESPRIFGNPADSEVEPDGRED